MEKQTGTKTQLEKEAEELRQTITVLGKLLGERAGAEEELRYSKERLALALESASIGMWEYDVQADRLYYDPLCDTMLGFAPAEASAPLAAWMSLIHEEDRDRVIAAINEHLEGKSEGYTEEYRMQAASSEWRWLSSSGKVIERDADGKPLRMIGTRMDVTPRKRLEEALKEKEKRPKNGKAPIGVYEAIEKRRTIRFFTKGAPEEQLRRIILAGSKAPSGGNSQPWEFIIIDDPAVIEQLGELKYELNRTFKPVPGQTQQDVEERALSQKRGFANASVVAVCTTRGQSSSGWLAVENMSLAAVCDGLGSNIITYWDDARKKAEQLIGLPDTLELTCVLKVGVPEAPVSSPKRRPEFSWLHRNRFRERSDAS